MRELSFNVEAARRFGVDGAVMLQGMAVWISKNRANERHFHDGRWWTYNSKAALARLFPFWTEKQLRRIVKNLNDSGALLLGNYSDGSFHNTTWYAISDEVLALLGAEECAAAAETGVPIPRARAPRWDACATPSSAACGDTFSREKAEETTCPNGQVAESTCPNGQVYLPKRAEDKQIDTNNIPPVSPPEGAGSMSEEFDRVCQLWYRHDGSLPVIDRDATFTEYLKARQTSNLAPLLAGLETWVDALGPARLPLWKVLSGEPWRETWREDPFFWLFWQIYPRKIDKDRARRAWAKLKPDRATSKAILESLRRWKLCDQWQEERFIPHPATWLNGRRWEATPPGMGRGSAAEAEERQVEEWT